MRSRRISEEDYKQLQEFKKQEAERKKKEREERKKNHKPTVYGYARVSTPKQSFNEQIEALEKDGIKRKNIYAEQYTGKTTNRPAFNDLREMLLEGDTVVVTKLDRLARNTEEALRLMTEFRDHKVNLKILNMSGKAVTIDDSPMGKFSFTMFSAFAQFERDLIIDRMNEGKKYAMKHNPNYQLGRPKLLSDAMILQAYKDRKAGATYKELQKKYQVGGKELTRATLRNYFLKVKAGEIKSDSKTSKND